MSQLPPVERFISNHGVKIYRIPAVVFPGGFTGFTYVVLNAGVPTLIDTGSGYDRSTADILAGIESLKTDFGESITVKDIQRILVTHGHIDHFGGVAQMLEATGGAQVGIHPLDRRVLTHYEERVIVATKNLTIYLQRAGVRPERMANLLEMYGFSKKHVRSVNIELTLEEGVPLDGMNFYHVPGHCSGQVMIQIGDIVLSADHILPRTSPHLAAESITHYTGAGHYLDSLHKAARLEDVRLALGGHETPVTDYYARVAQLEERLHLKIERVLDMIRQAEKPVSISDVSRILYVDKHGFDVLLALQEAGAYVEYLYDRGYLAIDNLEEFEQEDMTALRYRVI